jgi:hypothetical protein
MTVIFATMVLISGALVHAQSNVMQKAHAQSNVIHSGQQQKIGQPDNCRNNATCTDIGLISFMTPNQDKNDTKLNYDARQANPIIKDDMQKDTPFLLPFP